MYRIAQSLYCTPEMSITLYELDIKFKKINKNLKKKLSKKIFLLIFRKKFRDMK